MHNPTVTYTKAIAIILMVTGHAWCGSAWEHWVNHFHMPLFFFLSGYCFKDKYITEWTTFCRRRLQNVWLPYVKWGIFFVLIHNLLLRIHVYDTVYGYADNGESIYSMRDVITKTIMVLGLQHEEFAVCGFWFLRNLFWGSLIFLFTRKFITNKYASFVFLLVMTLVMSWKRINIPVLGISSDDCFAALFMTCGLIFKKYSHCEVFQKFHNNTPLSIINIILGIGVIELAYIVGVEYMKYCHVWWVIPCLIVAIVGIISSFSFCSIIDKYMPISAKRILSFIGDNTLAILTWHIISFKIVSYLIVAIYQIEINRVGENPVIVEYSNKGWWILYAMAGLIFPIIIVYAKSQYINHRSNL